MRRAALLGTPVQGPTTVASDTFTRADSSTTLGTADTGQTWTVPSSGAVWGISSGQACYVSGGPGQDIAVIDAGVANCTIQADMTVQEDCGLSWRVVDDSNYFLIASLGTVYVRSGGGFTSLATCSSTGTGTWKVVLSGSTHTIFRNGVQVASFTNSNFTTATKHGLRTFGRPAARWDNFTVTVP